jgi:hypothetical protein
MFWLRLPNGVPPVQEAPATHSGWVAPTSGVSKGGLSKSPTQMPPTAVGGQRPPPVGHAPVAQSARFKQRWPPAILQMLLTQIIQSGQAVTPPQWNRPSLPQSVAEGLMEGMVAQFCEPSLLHHSGTFAKQLVLQASTSPHRGVVPVQLLPDKHSRHAGPFPLTSRAQISLLQSRYELQAVPLSAWATQLALTQYDW